MKATIDGKIRDIAFLGTNWGSSTTLVKDTNTQETFYIPLSELRSSIVDSTARALGSTPIAPTLVKA